MTERLGLSVPADGVADLTALARRAEERGWSDLWSMESRDLDAFTPLAAAAGVTERLRLGTAIVAAFLRPPGVTAMQAAGVAGLAPGRFALGLGASTKVVVEQWHGVPFPERPVSALAEQTDQIVRLLRGEKVGGLRLGIPPPDPVPLYLAALGPRALALAGEIADGVVLFMVGPTRLPEVLRQMGDGKDSVARIFAFSGNGTDVHTAARRLIVPYTLVPYYARSLTSQGFGEEVTAIGEAWRSGERDRAVGLVSDAMVRELTLTGSEDEIADGIQAYRRAGLGTPVVATQTGAEARRLVEALGPEG
jgi:alkanesulfonate monooxygenase SsuD/methylene tetrahydromethanopterin reductase-like flavin-dependent oxidoreductase (luciferase family)